MSIRKSTDMVLIAGNSNRALANSISDALDTPLAKTDISAFSDGETKVDLLDNMRGEDVFIIQSTSQPANHFIMELLIILDALKRSSARRITAVIPYFGYARQDAKPAPRTPITAKLAADLITAAGADRVLTMDFHSRQAQGFFNIPADNLYAQPLFVKDIKKRFPNHSDLVIVSPDAGGVVRARALAKKFDAEVAIIDKRRERANVSEVMHIIGDVEGRDCLVVDDLVDTAGTLCNGAIALMEKGATSVHAYATHGVLSGPANNRIDETAALSSLTITDSIMYPYGDNSPSSKVFKVSIADLLAKAIRRTAQETSISELFEDK
jgi:ribose-phosphate pyrophosphokinase